MYNKFIFGVHIQKNKKLEPSTHKLKAILQTGSSFEQLGNIYLTHI